MRMHINRVHRAPKRARLGYGRLTWQGLENVGIHVSLVLMVVYAVAIAAIRLGRPELRQSVAFFA